MGSGNAHLISTVTATRFYLWLSAQKDSFTRVSHETRHRKFTDNALRLSCDLKAIHHNHQPIAGHEHACLTPASHQLTTSKTVKRSVNGRPQAEQPRCHGSESQDKGTLQEHGRMQPRQAFLATTWRKIRVSSAVPKPSFDQTVLQETIVSAIQRAHTRRGPAHGEENKAQIQCSTCCMSRPSAMSCSSGFSFIPPISCRTLPNADTV